MKKSKKIWGQFSKMDKNKNVQNGFLRDYLFFWKIKNQKIQKFYFRCIIGKESKKFQNVFFCKKNWRRWSNGQKYVWVEIWKKCYKNKRKHPYINSLINVQKIYWRDSTSCVKIVWWKVSLQTSRRKNAGKHARNLQKQHI